ncbi:hypothetical protein EYC84_003402 [Monilinia fructicola]|uniref:Hydrophobin n=1 Tax=Monilinia fructicola TaxID=38448 RepID=A0A5M9JUE1_MONFR|nr:hypothetical protein EYC84_003402 [Monilinia fructicola]
MYPLIFFLSLIISCSKVQKNVPNDLQFCCQSPPLVTSYRPLIFYVPIKSKLAHISSSFIQYRLYND